MNEISSIIKSSIYFFIKLIKSKNKYFSKINLLTIFIIVFFFATGCNKDDLSFSAGPYGKELIKPQVLGDRYVFQDFDHFKSYYTDLYQVFQNDYSLFNNYVAENRSGVETVHFKLRTDVFSDPKDRYQPFLTDLIMMTIVNEYFEFQLDDILVMYMNNHDLLICYVDDLEIINDRNLVFFEIKASRQLFFVSNSLLFDILIIFIKLI